MITDLQHVLEILILEFLTAQQLVREGMTQVTNKFLTDKVMDSNFHFESRALIISSIKLKVF